MGPISFPGLGINNININPVAFHIGNWTIAWYGIIIAVALLLALLYGMKRSKQFGISTDDLADVVIFGIIFGIIGARLYYVLFFIDPTTGTNPYFSDPASILTIWKGGLGIYGGVIASFIAAFVVCKIKKISVGAVFDIAALGFLIGQAIGRWGNFVNQEAFGGPTNLPWRMVVSTATTPVHPCFLYESLWCILGFILLHNYSKHRKFNGEVFLMYIAYYAFGRFFIESLRADSLMLGNLKVTMLVAALFFIASVSILIYRRLNLKENVEGAASYNPLFADTSKAVDEEVASQSDDIEAEDAEEADASEGEDALTEDKHEETAPENTENEENAAEGEKPADGESKDTPEDEQK